MEAEPATQERKPFLQFPLGRKGSVFEVENSGTIFALGGKNLYVFYQEEEQERDESSNEPAIRCVSLKTASSSSVGALAWNPNHTSLAAAIGNTFQIWKWDQPSQTATQASKFERAHSRIITDMSWNLFKPYLIATRANDVDVKLWDTRQQPSPLLSLHSSGGRGPLAWNRLNSNILATAHDRAIHVWDIRKSTVPSITITAHLNDITSLDWDYFSEERLITGSQDKTIKVWSTNSPNELQYPLINLGIPVRQVRFTPFGGEGIVALGHGVSSLQLWNLRLSSPVHVFHSREVLSFSSFHWSNPYGRLDAKRMLMTWSKEESYVHAWKIDENLEERCRVTFTPQTETKSTPEFSHNNIEEKHREEGHDHECRYSSTPPTVEHKAVDLKKEFEAVAKLNIPNFEVKIDEVERTCVVKYVTQTGAIINMLISFPSYYPVAQPSFEFLSDTTISHEQKILLKKALNHVARFHMQHGEANAVDLIVKLVRIQSEMDAEQLAAQAKEHEKHEIENLKEDGDHDVSASPAQLISSAAAEPHHCSSHDSHVHSGATGDDGDGSPSHLIAAAEPRSCASHEDSQLRQRGITGDEGDEAIPKGDGPQHVASAEPHHCSSHDSHVHTGAAGDDGDISPSHLIAAAEPRSCASHEDSQLQKKEITDDDGAEAVPKGIEDENPEITVIESENVRPSQNTIQFGSPDDVIRADSPAPAAESDSEGEALSNPQRSEPLMNWLWNSVTRTLPLEINRKLTTEHHVAVSSSPFAGSVQSLGSSYGPEMQETSNLFTTQDFSKLTKLMPPRCRLTGWTLLYSTMEHGVSMSTFLNRVRGKQPTLLVIEDTNKHVFGAFCMGEWKSTGRWTGTGESFLFTLSPVFAFYKWSGQNDLIMIAGPDYIRVGGGGNIGLDLGSDFELGSSKQCETFMNDCLASEENFTIVVVEVWGMDK